MEDFEVHTNGNCFICGNNISAIKLEPESGPGSIKSSVHSLQYLSRFLKLDRRKVFDEEGVVPPDLLAKVEKATLKVELCQECICLNEAFSKLYLQLEKIEIEVTTCLTAIHSKLMEAKEAIPHSDISKSGEMLDGKLKIAEVLRSETRQKCFHKVKAIAPQIRMQNMSMKQMNAEKHQIKSHHHNQRKIISVGSTSTGFESASSMNPPEIAKHGVKVEEDYNSYSDVEENDDTAGNEYFDDYDNDVQNEEPDKVSPLESGGMATTTVNNRPVGSEVKNTLIDESECEKVGGTYKCRVCSKSFSIKGNWRTHYESIHLKVRYKCNLCGAEFTQRGHHKQHPQSIHLGVKFKCLVCNTTFTHKSALNRHQRTSCSKARGLPT